MAEGRERWTYDVFLSFRGPDVRSTILSHLYKNLTGYGIRTFKDNPELEAGSGISPSLLEAIEASKVLLVILSPNYASSSWCLDELLHIVKCRKKKSGHLVVPIFYGISPADVRRQTGSFGETFREHAKRHPQSKVKNWMEALIHVANLSGFVNTDNRSEADFIQNVTTDILKKVSVSYKHLPTFSVGIRPRVHRITEIMRFGSDDVQITGICGMGGIGKTTLAKATFNELALRFEGASFLENFGLHFKKPEGKALLQRQLISDILGGNDALFINMDHTVKQRFRNKRVLVVIDDVEDMRQLDSAAIDSSCFGPGSKIIITSRNNHLLEQLEAENIYSPTLLDSDESLNLVSWHAFRAREPPEAFLQHSEKLVEYCGGLPLAVEVLAAFLYKRPISAWKSTLESLKRIPHDDIQAKLQISFDALSTTQKDIFLDISCFFIGMDEEYVDCILDACKFDPGIGLTVLKERCLITVDDNKLMMHDLLRDMGRHVVRRKSPNNYGKWSRLWDRDHIIDVLGNDYGTYAIEGLSLKAEDTAVEDVEVKAFSNLKRLRLLQLSHVALNGSYEKFPKGIRWLCWLGFPEDSLPINLHLRSLVVMDMQNSNLKRLWNDQKKLQFLKDLTYLDLSHSIQLIETPDFSCFPNLEKLLLINCRSLVMVHKSIGTLQRKLVLLNLSGCIKLGELPLDLYKLKSLETLILSGCSQLERLDDALGNLESLTTLKADYTAIMQIPSSVDQLKKLKELSLDGCKELWKTRDLIHSDESPLTVLSSPLSFNGLTCLKTLRLGFCNLSDELIPENLGRLSCLEELDLQGNNFRNLSTDFAGLLSLHILKLDGCSELQSMYSLPKKLRSLFASNCFMLERTPDLSECSTLGSLHLTNCFSLVATPGLEKLKNVGVIHMEMCNRISDSYKERIMQGWAVSANGGIFIPGSSLPSWVSFKNETHSISFTVPGKLNYDLVGFTLWTPYVSQQDDVISAYPPKITLKNQTKGDACSRSPATDLIRMYCVKHIWQGHYSIEDLLLKTGDQVELSVDFGPQVTIHGIGLTFTYREVPVTPNEELPQIDEYEELADREDEDDIDPVVEESQRRTGRILGVGLRTLLGAFGTLAFIVIVAKHGGTLRRHNRLCSIKAAKDKENDARLKIFSRLHY